VAAINRPLPGVQRGIPVPFGFGPINWWIVGALGVFAVGALLPVLQNSGATSRGFDVQRLQGDETRLNSDIRVVESEVASLTSLNRITQRAAEIGLGPAIAPYYVTVDEPGPSPAKVPSEYLPGPAPKGGQPDPWWRSLLSWVPLGK